MKNPVRNETSLVLVVALILSAIAIPALSGFLEPSQPPAVAAVQVGHPRDDGGGVGDDGAPADKPKPQPEPEIREPRPSRDNARARPPAEQPARPAPSAQPAPPAPADDAADDDGGGED